jgi:tetratricopeptide (TPR) repeat protein
MRKFLLLPVLFLHLLHSSAQTIDSLLSRAGREMSAKRYKEAMQLYTKAWEKDSMNYRLLLDRGILYVEMKESEKAFYDFSRAIDLRPDSAEPYHRRAVILYSMMYTDEAIMDNTRALELAKDDTMRLMSFMNRGADKVQKRDFQGAYEDFTRASLIKPDDIGIINNISTVLDELGREKEAIDNLMRAIKIDSTFIGPYVNIGFLYTKLKRYKEAIVYFNKALIIEKDEPLTLNNRGLAKYYLNDLAGALDDINKSLSAYPGNSYAYKNRALVYLAKKENDKACADLKKANEKGFTQEYGEEVNELLKANCK